MITLVYRFIVLWLLLHICQQDETIVRLLMASP